MRNPWLPLSLLLVAGVAGAIDDPEPPEVTIRAAVAPVAAGPRGATLRGGPKREAAAIATLPAGTLVLASSATRNAGGVWWYITSGRLIGWAHESELVNEPGLAALAPLPDLPQPPPVPQGWDDPDEVARFMQRLRSGNPAVRGDACRDLLYTGIMHTPLFDELAQRLDRQYQDAIAKEIAEPDVPWCVRALAASGDARYLATILQWERAPGGLVKRFLKRNVVGKSEAYLAQFAQWNPVIRRRDGHPPGQPWDVTRTINMLRADDPVLQREGLKRARKLRDKNRVLYDVIAQQLLREAPLAGASEQDEDVAAWFCKFLADSGDPKYKPTLSRVLRATKSEKLRDYAEAALERLGG